jgi:hypothetical protein
MLNKIALVGILLIILVLVIVFLIVGIRTVFSDNSKHKSLKNNIPNLNLSNYATYQPSYQQSYQQSYTPSYQQSYTPSIVYSTPNSKMQLINGGAKILSNNMAKYGGGVTRYDKYLNSLNALKSLFMGDIRSMMMYFDKGRLYVRGEDNPLLHLDDSTRLTDEQNINNKRIIAFGFRRKGVDYYNKQHIFDNSEKAIDNTNIANSYFVDVLDNTNIYKTVYSKTRKLNRKRDVVQVPIDQYFERNFLKADTPISFFNPDVLDTTKTLISDEQVGIIKYFDKIYNDGVDKDKSIIGNLENKFKAIAVLGENYLKYNSGDYLLGVIKGICNDNKQLILEGISKDANSIENSDSNKLSNEIYDIINGAKTYKTQMLTILREIIKLADYHFYINNSDDIKLYINIFCEFLNAEKGFKTDIELILDLYNIYFGDPNDIILNYKITDIILKLLQTYKLRSDVSRKDINNDIFGYSTQDKSNPSDPNVYSFNFNKCGLNFESLFYTYKKDIIKLKPSDPKYDKIVTTLIDHYTTGKTINDAIKETPAIKLPYKGTDMNLHDAMSSFGGDIGDKEIFDQMLKMDIYDFNINCKNYMKLFEYLNVTYRNFDTMPDGSVKHTHKVYYIFDKSNTPPYRQEEYYTKLSYNPIFFYTRFILERLHIESDGALGSPTVYSTKKFIEYSDACKELLPHLIINKVISLYINLKKTQINEKDAIIIIENLKKTYKLDKTKNLDKLIKILQNMIVNNFTNIITFYKKMDKIINVLNFIKYTMDNRIEMKIGIDDGHGSIINKVGVVIGICANDYESTYHNKIYFISDLLQKISSDDDDITKDNIYQFVSNNYNNATNKHVLCLIDDLIYGTIDNNLSNKIIKLANITDNDLILNISTQITALSTSTNKTNDLQKIYIYAIYINLYVKTYKIKKSYNAIPAVLGATRDQKINELINKMYKFTNEDERMVKTKATEIITNKNKGYALRKMQGIYSAMHNFLKTQDIGEIFKKILTIYSKKDYLDIVSIAPNTTDSKLFIITNLDKYKNNIKTYMPRIYEIIIDNAISNTKIENPNNIFYPNELFLSNFLNITELDTIMIKTPKEVSDYLDIIKYIEIFYACVEIYLLILDPIVTKFNTAFKQICDCINSPETLYHGEDKDPIKEVSFSDCITYCFDYHQIYYSANKGTPINIYNFMKYLYNDYSYWEYNIGLNWYTNGAPYALDHDLSHLKNIDNPLNDSWGYQNDLDNKKLSEALTYIEYTFKYFTEEIKEMFLKINMRIFYEQFMIYKNYSKKFIGIDVNNLVINNNDIFGIIDYTNICSVLINNKPRAQLDQPPQSVYHRLTKVLKNILLTIKLSNRDKYDSELNLDQLKTFLLSNDIKPDIYPDQFTTYTTTGSDSKGNTINIIDDDHLKRIDPSSGIMYYSGNFKDNLSIDLLNTPPDGTTSILRQKNKALKKGGQLYIDDKYNSNISYNRDTRSKHTGTKTTGGLEEDEFEEIDSEDNSQFLYSEMLEKLRVKYMDITKKFSNTMKEYTGALNKLNWSIEEEKIDDNFSTLILKKKQDYMFQIQKVSKLYNLIPYQENIMSNTIMPNTIISNKKSKYFKIFEMVVTDPTNPKKVKIKDPITTLVDTKIISFKYDLIEDTYYTIDNNEGQIIIKLKNDKFRYGKLDGQMIRVKNNIDNTIDILNSSGNTLYPDILNSGILLNVQDGELDGKVFELMNILYGWNNNYTPAEMYFSIDLSKFQVDSATKWDSKFHPPYCNIDVKSNYINSDNFALYWGRTDKVRIFRFNIEIFKKNSASKNIEEFDFIKDDKSSSKVAGISLEISEIIDNELNNDSYSVSHKDYFMSLMKQVKKNISYARIKELNYFAEKNYILWRLINCIRDFNKVDYAPRPRKKAWYDEIDEGLFYQYIPFSINQNEQLLTQLQKKVMQNPDTAINVIQNLKDKLKGLNFRPAPKSRFNPKKHTLEEILERLKKGVDVFEGSYWFVDDDHFSSKEELIIGQ